MLGQCCIVFEYLFYILLIFQVVLTYPPSVQVSQPRSSDRTVPQRASWDNSAVNRAWGTNTMAIIWTFFLKIHNRLVMMLADKCIARKSLAVVKIFYLLLGVASSLHTSMRLIQAGMWAQGRLLLRKANCGHCVLKLSLVSWRFALPANIHSNKESTTVCGTK